MFERDRQPVPGVHHGDDHGQVHQVLIRELIPLGFVHVVEDVGEGRIGHGLSPGQRRFTPTRQAVEPLLRFAGGSKYGWRKLFGLAFDGMLSFSTAPIRMATWLGLLTVAMTMLLGCYFVGTWYLGNSPRGFTALATSIAFFSGVQLVFLGLIGEYVGRIYEEVKGRPLYVVRRVITPSDSQDVAAYRDLDKRR